MSAKNYMNPPESISPCMSPLRYSASQSEITLADLFKLLFKQRSIIFSFTLVTTLVATLYSVYATPIYKAEVIFLPPLPMDVASLQVSQLQDLSGSLEKNQNAMGHPNFSVERIYSDFKVNLKSTSLLEQFLSKNAADLNLKNNLSISQNLESFRKKISILDDKKDNSTLRLVLQWEDNADQAAQIANDIVVEAKNITVDQLYSELRYFIDSSAKKLEDDIFIKKEYAKKIRQDELSRLYEALSIADKLGLSEASQSFSLEKTNINLLNNSSLYLSGTKALQAQIATLQNRKSDDPFIPGLRELESQLSSLQSFSLNKHSIDVARIDQPAYALENPIKPKVKLIVVLGFVLGLMMGILTAFIANYWSSNREKF